MLKQVKQIRSRAQRLNRAFQEWLACFILFMGALQLLLLVLLLPDTLKGIFTGDPVTSKTFLMSVIAIGICWLQWRYRHVVYPQMRRQAKAHGG